MKKRFLLPLLLFFLPATIISAAYAGFVYSNKVDTKTDSNSGKIDDVKPNFKLDENNYTIYFFPSAQAARINFESPYDLLSIQQKISKESPYENDKNNKDPKDKKGAVWGFWSGNTDNERYFPKVVNTVGGPSISLEQFEGIGEPFTNGFDKKKKGIFYADAFKLSFSGWTANRDSSLNMYAGHGEYNTISAFDDLTKIDNETNDGTKAKDKVIFLYPIFTTGKDYDNKMNSVQILEDSKETSKTRFFSRVDGEENKSYFYYKNLVINPTDRFHIQFAGLITNSLGWYEKWYDYCKKIGDKLVDIYLFNMGQNENAIIGEPGVYNVYVYLQRQRNDLFGSDFKPGDAALFNSTINGNNIPLIYEDVSDPSISDSFKRSLSSHDFWLFVKVEKVYEFRLAGTEGRGFTFNTAGQLYVSNFSSAKYASSNLGVLWKMYYLDNVFMEKGKNNLFTEYTNSSGDKYKIRNTVFSFLPSDENLTTIEKIEQMNQEELDFVNQEEPDSNVGEYLGISTSSFRDIKDNPGDYIKEPENLPNYVPGNDYANYFFASEFKYSGFCKVLIKVDFATFGDHKGKPTSIRVAVAPYLTNVHKVYVYPDETNLVLFRDPDTKLIDPENNTTLKAIELTSFEMQASDDYELKDQNITVRNNATGSSTSMLLSEYLANNEVIDHLTNKSITIGKSYKRHMACWQRARTKN